MKLHVSTIILVVGLLVLSNIALVDDSSIHSMADLSVTYNRSYTRVGIKDFDLVVTMPPQSPESDGKWLLESNYIRPDGQVPYRFRVLGNRFALLLASFLPYGIGISFYYIFVLLSFLFLAASCILAYKSVCALTSEKKAWMATLISLSPPSMMFMFKHPMMLTVNDSMAMLIASVAVYAIIRNKIPIAILSICAGMLCRETLLAVSLFIVFLPNIKIRDKIISVCVPLLILIAWRWYMSTNGYVVGYNPFDVWKANWEMPMEAFAFMFTLYGGLWIFLAVGFRGAFSSNLGNLGIYIKASLPVLFSLLFFHYSMAAIMEMRITSTIFFPFSVIIIACALDSVNVRRLAQSKFLLYICAIISISCVSYIWFYSAMDASLYAWAWNKMGLFFLGIPGYLLHYLPQLPQLKIVHGWLGIGLIHAAIFLVALPLFFPALILLKTHSTRD